MSTPYNIAFQLESSILIRLITEQLVGTKSMTCDPARKPDCIIIHQEGPRIECAPNISVLEIPKGTVRLGEILDKLRYILSGRESHIEGTETELDLGRFILIPAENLLICKEDREDKEIRLTDKERLLLRVLYQAGETGLPRQDLLKAVWGYADDAETHTLETHIYRLRQKLENFSEQNMIKAADGSYSLDIKKPA